MLSCGAFHQEGSVINQTTGKKFFPVIFEIFFFYFLPLLWYQFSQLLPHRFFIELYYFVYMYVALKKILKKEHSEPLIATTTTKVYALYTVCRYFSSYCDRHVTTCRTSTRGTNSRTATVPEKTLNFGLMANFLAFSFILGPWCVMRTTYLKGR